MQRAAYKLSSDILLQEVANEMVILNLADGQYYGLNEVGARIIQLMSNGENISSITQTLLEEFDVEQAVLERDIQNLIEELQQHALIESAG
jgi:hypothetical protein